jgi:hypothetical protein
MILRGHEHRSGLTGLTGDRDRRLRRSVQVVQREPGRVDARLEFEDLPGPQRPEPIPVRGRAGTVDGAARWRALHRDTARAIQLGTAGRMMVRIRG